MRHGERYPTRRLGTALTAALQAVRAQNLTARNGLAFLNTYESPALDASNYDNETTAGPYSGFASMFLLGAELRRWYGHLWDPEEHARLPFFAAGQHRVVVSAQNAARGFFGTGWRERARFVVLSEVPEQGLNSLTPDLGCPRYDGTHRADYAARYSERGLEAARARLQRDLPGARFSHQDVAGLMALCHYDLNVAGESPWCGYFAADDWRAFEHYRSLQYYYHAGPGNPLGQALGSVVANASLALLRQPANGSGSPLYLNFAHDSNLFGYMAAFGIAIPNEDLSWQHAAFPGLYSQLTPMAARINLEKLVCADDSGAEKEYVRFVINEAVFPYPNCTSGPGFSCPLDDYASALEARLQDTAGACGIDRESYAAPTNLTFYWDWRESDEKYFNDVSPNSSL